MVQQILIISLRLNEILPNTIRLLQCIGFVRGIRDKLSDESLIEHDDQWSSIIINMHLSHPTFLVAKDGPALVTLIPAQGKEYFHNMYVMQYIISSLDFCHIFYKALLESFCLPLPLL